MLASFATLGAPAAWASPEEDLRAAIRAYERSEYSRVIELVRPLLYPRNRLSSQTQLLEAYKLLGLGYLFEKDKDSAERQFLAILSHRPDYRLDPLVDPLAAVELLEEVKRKNAEKLKSILDRERRETERRIKEAELKKLEEERRKALLARRGQVVIERTTEKRFYFINFVPFGAGQFQNGHRRKAFTLLGTEAALGALSLGTALAYRVAWPDGRVPREDRNLAKGLAITQVAAGALFFAAVAYGIIDALVYYRPETRTERRYEKKSGLLLVPSLGLVGPQDAAASGRSARTSLRVGLDIGLAF